MSAVKGGKKALQDLSTFFAPVIPEEVKIAVTLLHKYPLDELKILIERVFTYLASSKRDQDDFEISSNLLGSDTNQPEVNTILTGIYLTVRTAVRTKVKLSSIHANLISMNMPEEFSKIVCKGLMKFRQTIEKAAKENRIQLPKLQTLRWRVDVTVSSGSLSRIMRPNILFQMILKNGSMKTFEVSIAQFHQLRYNVANALNDMHTLDRHPIIKVVKDIQKREEEEQNR
jgi:hypothetical protein